MTAELIVESTGEVIQQLTTSEASELTAEIRSDLVDMAGAYERVMPKIRLALTRRAWDALGYVSVSAYVSEEFSGSLGRLGYEARRGVVNELAAAGMSTRAIAPVVGVSRETVRTDLTGDKDLSPQSDEPSKIIGIDGKAYQQPKLKPSAEPISRQETSEESERRQIEQGWRDTCTRIAECVRFLDGGAAYGQSFLREFYPHEADYLAPGMRLTQERIDSCIEFLQTIRNGVDR